MEGQVEGTLRFFQIFPFLPDFWPIIYPLVTIFKNFLWQNTVPPCPTTGYATERAIVRGGGGWAVKYKTVPQFFKTPPK